MLTISDIKKTKNSVNPMNRFSQLQRAGQSYRPVDEGKNLRKSLLWEQILPRTQS